ncbi:MAG: aminoglycoside phosphotransferase family protein [Anaerolineae bacterium]|nr:aminoglycoside phosphotransferase family protein [Anaerolineae bacterium]
MEQSLQTIDEHVLPSLVRQALADPKAEIATWEIETIYGGWGGAVGGTALYRITGRTEQGKPWSLVLKILYERLGEAETSPYYWRREYEIYRSGLLDQLPECELTPPTIYHCVEFADSCWIWMEAIPAAEQAWTLDDYRTVARRLGQFSAAYLTGHPIPDYPWLAANWHCRITPPLAETFDRLDEYLQHPLVQRTLPLDEKETILEIWQQFERYCAGLADLPQTLCHYDAFQRNMFHRPDHTILIDWALAGLGAIGEDIVPMVALPPYFGMPVSQAESLDQAVFAGYVDGLRDAGWQGDAQLARRGYVYGMVLRGLAGVKQDIGLLIDESRHPMLRREYHCDAIERIADRFADVRRFRLIQMAAEARQLLI